VDSEASLLWAVLFGSIGLGFFIYGKKQRAVVPFLSGVALFIFPYFVSNVYMMVVIGVVFVALPYFIRL
jgi:predicted membrane protein